MTKYKCERCSSVFDEDELRGVSDPVGECGDRTAYVERGVCPECGNDDFDEAYECAVCGEYFTSDELAGNVCRECLHKYDNDFNTCYEVSLGETENVKINALLATLFKPEDIEEMILNYIEEKKIKVSCKTFIDADEEWFADELEEILERRKEKNVLQHM